MRVTSKISRSKQTKSAATNTRQLRRNHSNSYHALPTPINPPQHSAFEAENAAQSDRQPLARDHVHIPLAQRDPTLMPSNYVLSSPTDPLEQQADRVAKQLLQSPHKMNIRVSRQALTTEDALYRKSISNDIRLSNQYASSHLPNIVGEVLQQPGRPLEYTTRQFMQNQFSQDFSHIRVHTDNKAANSAKAINALAYTNNHNVVFANGQYAPNTPHGQGLLAHELTHALQQGNNSNTIQRSIKFEFQTTNHVWAVKNSGAADARLLPRKYAPTTKAYDPLSGEERGNLPAYLSTGHTGKAARKKGQYEFEEIKGPRVTEEASSGVDHSLDAQFIYQYQFKDQVRIGELLDKPVPSSQALELVSKVDNSLIDAMKGKFNPNTFEYIYLNADGSKLDIHLSKKRRFKRGHVNLMNLGRGKKPIDKKKAAQYVETWKVSHDSNGPYKIAFGQVSVKLIRRVDNAQVKGMKGQYNKNTWQKNYFFQTQFDGDKVKPGELPMPIHIDDEDIMRIGRVDFLRRKRLATDKEQTAIEVQSETKGVLEFETPKWFRKWDDLRPRIVDAVKICDAMNAQIGSSKEVKDGNILDSIKARKNTPNLGHVVEWPEAYSTDHLTNLRKDNRRLLVQITDPTWRAAIQSSEGIALSRFSELQKEHEGDVSEKRHNDTVERIFRPAFDDAKSKNSALNENQFANLKGFLQLIVTYIYRGQVIDRSGTYAKGAFTLLARTHFGSMFSLLNDDEKSLYRKIVNDRHDPILKQSEAPINATRTSTVDKRNPPNKLPAISLNRSSRFFFRTVGTRARTRGPKIFNWLKGIYSGKDSLRGGAISASMGAKRVNKTPGDKDYNLALFEVRSTRSHGGRTKTKDKWVSYAKDIFEHAAARSADTPDDPSTPKVNESSKTSLEI